MHPMFRRRFVLGAVHLALVVLPMSGWTAELPRTADHDYEPPAPGSYSLPVIGAAADGEVLDTRGIPARLRDLVRGRVTVLSFIYTRCAAARACPMATGVLRQLHRLSTDEPDLVRSLRLISLSFDPASDTPARMADYAAMARQDRPAAEWRFLTTASGARLRPILDAYGQAVERKSNPLDPTGPLNHILRVFLIDAEGQIRNIYSSDTLDLRLVMADVRTLLLESKRHSQRPLTPEEALARPGETATVAFRVRSAARVTNLTDPARPVAEGVLLVDAENGDFTRTPVERARVIVEIPATALEAFGLNELDALAKQYEGRDVAVTGRVAVESSRVETARGPARGPERVRITVHRPDQIRPGAVL